ncbi:MAG: ribosomal protein S18-alanine N-acetyltransferase [Acidimicrobiia bacterium]|nr:ribosomal protein S18-alanine N-acetyltransferase [Acidimicrobiia bacterium]MBT8250896.1 ribosomal protein S18-alanine N-acetyltransferase [Acidimicrobiia bacterium]NND13837.1 ribosomal protein S18-alanine N-acetyltransferase [Acidimicrobiia bacterium]NNL29061.1 ribosomal protein S18-alanine N-acetyltransferase [Acidimicrobiia bacterium]NNL47369.1 ribosomal protein S18-alanine N-acetyltransferase [Acidimicrobiia bacterium]
MERDDIDQVVAIEEASYVKPWPERLFIEELDLESRRYFIVDNGEGIVGYGGLMLAPDEAHVITLAVHPDHRGIGFGADLLRRLFTEARENGAQHLTLEVRASNHSARSLYERFGFQEAGVRKGYYGNDDAIIMFAHDIDSEFHASHAGGHNG